MRAPAVLLLLGAVAACGSEPPAPPLEVSAEVRQYRNDVAVRRLSVTVTNGGPRPVTIRGVRLAAPGFAALPVADPGAELAPGDRVDLPVPYGDVSCDPPPSPGPDLAELLVQVGSAPPREMRVELPRSDGLLQRLRTKDCAQQELAKAVDVRLGPTWIRDGKRLSGSLVLTRRSGSQPIRVTETGGHIVFTVRPAVPFVPLAPAQPRVELPLVVTATRCDGHALSQNSRGSVFTFYVQVGSDQPLQVPASADPPLQGQLDRLATDTCVPQG